MRQRTWRRLLLLVASVAGLAVARARRAPGSHAPRTQSAIAESSPWASPEACEREVAAGHRAPRLPGQARVGAWNIRWFPDGNPGAPKASGAGPRATNVRWLACAIAYLDVDVLALEEIKASPAAATALAELRTRLDALAGGTHRIEVDRCPAGGRQSVAVLWDDRRVRGSGFRNVDSLNPHGSACDEHLRPGFGGYFQYPGGADFHFLAVHLKSGERANDLELRRASVRGIPRALEDVQSTARDADLLLAGDFNTMGCLDCSPKVRAREELREFSANLTGLAVPFRDVPLAESCTEYYRGDGQVLDHVVASAGMTEVSPTAAAHVDGYCAALSCGRLDPHGMPRAYEELSDHCPVYLDVSNRDQD